MTKTSVVTVLSGCFRCYCYTAAGVYISCKNYNIIMQLNTISVLPATAIRFLSTPKRSAFAMKYFVTFTQSSNGAGNTCSGASL